MHAIAGLAALVCVWPAAADPFGWDDLPDPSAQVFDDPFVDMSAARIDALRSVLVGRLRLEEASLDAEAREKLADEVSALEAALAAEGVDADAMLAERDRVIAARRNAATAVNPLLDGREISLAGWLVPAPPEDGGTHVVYLVPEAGMCSHMPPPPPNKLVRVELSAPLPLTVQNTPARITGELRAERTRRQMVFVDGFTTMDSAWTLASSEVRTTQDAYARLRPGADAPHSGSASAWSRAVVKQVGQ